MNTADATTNDVLLEQMLQQDVADGVFGLGAQAAMHRRGHPLVDIAIGEAAPGVAMTPRTLQNVWCASKPLLALAVLIVAERGALNLDEHVSRQFPRHEALRLVEVSPRQLLNHAGGFCTPRAFDALLTRPADRLNTVVLARGDQQVGYSEYAGWRLLDEVLSTLGQTSAANVVLDEVVQHLGLEDEVLFDLGYADHLRLDERHGAIYSSLPFSRAMSQHDAVVYLSRSDRVITGASMTARALATLYGAVLAVYDGTPVRGLPSTDTLRDALARPRGPVYDSVLDRHCDFAAGFMVDLPAHGMSTGLPPESFGHSGMTGSIFALANPATSTALAVVFNGTNATIEDARLLYRRYSELCA